MRGTVSDCDTREGSPERLLFIVGFQAKWVFHLPRWEVGLGVKEARYRVFFPFLEVRRRACTLRTHPVLSRQGSLGIRPSGAAWWAQQLWGSSQTGNPRECQVEES